MPGQRVGYVRISTVEQNADRQLDGVAVEHTFVDQASGKDTQRPELEALLKFVRAGDTVVVHSMDRLARNLGDLLEIVRSLTDRDVHVDFVKEHLTFTGDESPMATLMLSVMGAVAEFERALIRERQREGIQVAKKRGAYRGSSPRITPAQAVEMRDRVQAGESKALVARAFGVSRQTLYRYLATVTEIEQLGERVSVGDFPDSASDLPGGSQDDEKRG